MDFYPPRLITAALLGNLCPEKPITLMGVDDI